MCGPYATRGTEAPGRLPPAPSRRGAAWTSRSPQVATPQMPCAREFLNPSLHGREPSSRFAIPGNTRKTWLIPAATPRLDAAPRSMSVGSKLLTTSRTPQGHTDLQTPTSVYYHIRPAIAIPYLRGEQFQGRGFFAGPPRAFNWAGP